MSGQIRMTPETMRQRAGEYTTQANNLDSIIRKMDSLLKQLQSEWEGDSSRATQRNLHSFVQDLQRLKS